MSPRTSAENERVRAESRARIMATALEQFAENGYHNTSISKVAKAAGISKGLMYNYFESKEALLEAILHNVFKEQEMDLAGEEMEHLKSLTPPQILAFTIESFFDSIIQDKKRWTWILTMSIEVINIPRIQTLMTEGYKTGIQHIKDALALNGYKNVELEAKLLAATFDGIAIQYVLFGEEYDILSVKETLIQKYCT